MRIISRVRLDAARRMLFSVIRYRSEPRGMSALSKQASHALQHDRQGQTETPLSRRSLRNPIRKSGGCDSSGVLPTETQSILDANRLNVKSQRRWILAVAVLDCWWPVGMVRPRLPADRARGLRPSGPGPCLGALIVCTALLTIK